MYHYLLILMQFYFKGAALYCYTCLMHVLCLNLYTGLEEIHGFCFTSKLSSFQLNTIQRNEERKSLPLNI